MKKSNNKLLVCKGINNAVSILGSTRFNIEYIDVLREGKAINDDKIKTYLKSFNINILEKEQFYKKYADGRTQGIIIGFKGELIENNLPDFDNKKDICLLVLDQIEDPQNFGQIIRTAECAGINGIIFPKHHSAPITDSVLQVSQGAFANMPLYEVTNLNHEIMQLKKSEFWVIGLENSINAKPWYDVEFSGKTVIVVGSEGRGIRHKVLKSCDFIATIPMQGKTNSLNVSAAVSAVAFERIRQLQKG